MSYNIPNFSSLSLLTEDNAFFIFRGRDLNDQKMHLIKCSKESNSTQEILNNFTKEYKILNQLKNAFFLQPSRIETTDERVMIICRDFEGEALSALIQNRSIDHESFFKIAALLTLAVGELHENNLLFFQHLNPKYILVSPNKDEIKFVDATLLTPIDQKLPPLLNPMFTADNFQYLSPEQTGLISWPIDYRTDIYSLGIILYEMLTFTFPFPKALSPQQILENHLTKAPLPPDEINSDISHSLSSIVMRCLSKHPDERYLNVFNLKDDLDHCYKKFLSSEKAHFLPGQQDRIQHFSTTVSPWITLSENAHALDQLIYSFIDILKNNIVMDNAYLVLKEPKNGTWAIHAEKIELNNTNLFSPPIPINEKLESLCPSAILEVEKQKKPFSLNPNEISKHYLKFPDGDPYVHKNKVESFLCIPLLKKNHLIGILYVENKTHSKRFTEKCANFALLISSQMAHTLDTALRLEQLEKQNEENVEELKKVQNQLIQQEKLAALGLLTAGIAHEIKNPLNFIINFSELSLSLAQEIQKFLDDRSASYEKDDFEDIASTLEMLKTNTAAVHDQGKRADAIIKRMLAHSGGNREEFLPTDINALIDECIALSYHGMRAQDSSFNTKFEKNYDQNLTEVMIAPQEISRVLLNLLNNAYYTVTQKKKMLGDQFNPLIVVKTEKFDDQVVIKIKDNGNGISDDIAQKIFTPFFTTKPVGQGTGLGLSLSYDIITKQHQGSLRFETKVNEFTEFIITLPKNHTFSEDNEELVK